MPDMSALRELALEQGGAFTAIQAVTCGWTAYGVRRAVDTGAWKRLHPGVLVEQSFLDGLDAKARHLAMLHARLLFRGEGWHAARRSAALVHGLALIGEPPAIPQLVRAKTGPRLRGHVRHERIASLPPEDCTHKGVPVTSLARTVVDVARAESFANAVVVADSALSAGLAPSTLDEVATRCAGWPGGAAARRVVRFADGRAATPLESLSRVAFDELGVPAPELQVEIWDHGLHVARVDFLWRAQHVVGESDGRSKYNSVQDLYEEKRREERLRDLGFEVVRWDWAAAYRPDAGFGATIQRALRRGALNTLAPGVTLRTTSVPLAA
jgi:hypothetical protein